MAAWRIIYVAAFAAALSPFATAAADYDVIVVPGGRTAAAPLIASDEVMSTLRTFNEAGKLVGGLCSGTTVLEASGVLAGRLATGYTGYGAKLTSARFVADEVAVWDANVVTSQGPCAPYPFAFKVSAQRMAPPAAPRIVLWLRPMNLKS